MPQDVLAAAALRVGANARALMYYESHVRAAEGGGLNPAALVSVKYGDGHVSFLQVGLGVGGWVYIRHHILLQLMHFFCSVEYGFSVFSPHAFLFFIVFMCKQHSHANMQYHVCTLINTTNENPPKKRKIYKFSRHV